MSMKEYNGYKYFQDKDGLWKVVLGDNSLFIVALDDSKFCGYRKVVWEKNNEETCREYIDYINQK